MAVTVLKNSVHLNKASHLYFTPWVFDSTNDIWKPGTTTYDIVEILADTIAIEQGDPTTETIDWEFGDTPLMSTSTKGERTVTAACIDISNDILHNVFGWSVDANDIMAYESASAESYATYVVTFHSASAPMVVLPKVSLNSKLTIGTLKTSTGQAELTGTAMSAYISYTDGASTPHNATGTTEIAVIKPEAGGTIDIFNAAPASGQTAVTIGTIAVNAASGEFYLT